MVGRRAAILILAAAALAGCSTGDDAAIEAEATALIVGKAVGGTGELRDEDLLSAVTTTVPAVAPPVALAASDRLTLGRGINIGNSLEAPREGDWGAGLDESYFRIIAEAGFDHIRLPVSWADYADLEPPYTIPDGLDPTITHPDYDNIWERVDWAIDQAEVNGLQIIVNFHHYEQAQADPLAHRDRIIGMWRQIAPHYADAGEHVVFELFNEPYLAFYEDPQLWNDLLADLLAVVRESNPTRPVLIGPAGFNRIDFLDQLIIPDDDNIIVTVHLYEPLNFTHQGADWLDDIPSVGVPWFPEALGWAEDIYDRSWDSRVITEDGKLRIDFARQWAGFSVDYIDPVAPTNVRFTVEGEGSLRIGCRVEDVDELDQARITTTAEPQEFLVDLTDCSREASGVSVMNQSADLTPVWISKFEFCSEARGCENIVTSADASLRRWVREASAWGAENGYPMHIGEFGAYSADGVVPMADRAAWTSTVVDEATKQGMSFAYWEFHSGYAAYDLDAEVWVPELRNALLG